MTLRNFASKYDLPLNQVKAAMHVPTGLMNLRETHEKMYADYKEEQLILEMTVYYMEDMRFCIERANKDNMALKRLADGCKGVSSDAEMF